MPEISIPTYRDLMYPTLVAVQDLGGSAKVAELDEAVLERAGVTDEQLAVEFPEDARTTGSKVIHRIQWARTYLKAIGALDNSERGVWAINQKGLEYLAMDPAEADEALRQADNALRAEWRKARKVSEGVETDDEAVEDGLESEQTWKNQLLAILQAMTPEGFERLAMRILREAGFTNVEVTQAGADGGIDGVGVYRPSLVSFPIYFQCKKWAGGVGARVVRDFRGAMAGRGEKGIVITSSHFTPEAKKEATRDGAPPVDLIGGDELCDLLKEYGLGVTMTPRTVYDVAVDSTIFDSV
jgi:restriction system protein